MTHSAGDFASRFEPAIEDVDGHAVHQFRGIQYGTVAARFAEPEAVRYEESTQKVDCTKFGPICPQVPIDFHHLLRVPKSIQLQESPVAQDEFGCLNLDITAPATIPRKLPVLIWIHGGSQTMTFMPASSPCADVVPFVANSIKQNEPVIVVFINYRLSIFAFGNGKGSKNLALKDQRVAIDWVVKHIDSFGGDPNNITLAGESAGAVYVHAHVLTGSPVQRAILQSGSLYLSQPQNFAKGDMLCENLDKILRPDNLASASVSKVLSALEEAGVVSLWLQLTPELEGWETRPSHVQEFLIGDVEFESAIWRRGVGDLIPSQITSYFDSTGEYAEELKRVYNIVEDRYASCTLGALDFINDTRFSYPVMRITEDLRARGATVYNYVFDEPNPWQTSARAHHAVELVLLFGRIDWTEKPAAAETQQQIRDRWSLFCGGKAPWEQDRVYAFGPHGRCGTISQLEHKSRRRMDACKLLEKMGSKEYDALCARLAAGRISLLN
ncbi:hypothetical protein LZ554_002656 [Drepanopeziza brunnea f. sp. 'monogermtubi']|nr:hypothetical protein LZ554_002656 [Drepanopeziza brunnea f. sp. 'monogermtubi']